MLCRHVTGSNHRRRGRNGNHHGNDFASGDVALWLRQASGGGGDCGIGNLGAVNSAELGAAGIERSDWSFGEGLVFGALIPGLMLSGSYILYVLGLAFLQPHVAPALPIEARQIQGRALVIKVMNAIVPTVLLIFVILGSIFFGFATPTEAGAVGTVGACALAARNE